MVEAIIALLGEGLKIWQLKESRKYSEKLMEIETALYEENNKPESDRSDAVRDNLKFELRVLTEGITAELREQNASH